MNVFVSVFIATYLSSPSHAYHFSSPNFFTTPTVLTFLCLPSRPIHLFFLSSRDTKHTMPPKNTTNKITKPAGKGKEAQSSSTAGSPTKKGLRGASIDNLEFLWACFKNAGSPQVSSILVLCTSSFPNYQMTTIHPMHSMFFGLC